MRARDEAVLREGFVQSLPRLVKAHLHTLRAASASLGWDFNEEAWAKFASEHGLPVASTYARAAGGGSFSFAKFLAEVGPLPPHPGGARFAAPRRSRGDWSRERLLLGAATVARLNRGWPARDKYDDVARKARERGVEVPLIDVALRQLGLTYTQLKRAANDLTAEIAAADPGEGAPRTYDRADEWARGMALGVELLGGHRPPYQRWDRAIKPYQSRGVPSVWTIRRVFGSWRAGWDHVDRLGLDAGKQDNPRPRYGLDEAIARGMALVEDRLGYRPRSKQWDDAVRELKREVGPGVIPAKSTIYYHFSTFNEGWLLADRLRARGIV